MSVFLAVAVSLVVRESAVTWSRSATGPVIMTMRHPSALRAQTALRRGGRLSAQDGFLSPAEE